MVNMKIIFLKVIFKVTGFCENKCLFDKNDHEYRKFENVTIYYYGNVVKLNWETHLYLHIIFRF